MKNLDWEKLAFEFQTTSISITKIAEREGVSRWTVTDRFKKLGIDIPNKQNRCKFNNKVFDYIDTEEKAYWLGFIFADGYISSTPLKEDKKSVYSFELSLQLSDMHHLEKFKDFVNYEKEVKTDKYRCRIMFANKHFWTTLNSYGCTPKKSLTLMFPDVSIFKDINLIRHFIRGYFDGDGCLSRHISSKTVTPAVSILGTRNFLENIMNYSNTLGNFTHDKRHSEETWTLTYRKEAGVNFINYLYSNCNIYLDRKYKLFNFFKKGSRSLKEFKELLSDKIGKNPTIEDNSEVISETKESETP